MQRRRIGVMYVPAKVGRPDGRGKRVALRMLVDTGAVYSVLPADVWRALRLRPLPMDTSATLTAPTGRV